ncbi:hypothetical protein BRARA_C04592 [Brassica rapa]|uniref:Uncharacterized protein n=1 Tax=Brassica campestris TaxID=3711 RepID=A0A398ABV5_BRACM|nr:hypothetical protein BRARA_C04592 [Brassica rapa]
MARCVTHRSFIFFTAEPILIHLVAAQILRKRRRRLKGYGLVQRSSLSDNCFILVIFFLG